MQSLVEIKNNQIVVSSRQIASNFGKLHKDVLRTIESLIRSAQNCANLFYERSLPDSYGRNQKCFLMNRDGFSLLAMGFTGKEALQWKLKYIAAFNEMEAKLKQLPKQQTLIEEAYKPSLKYYRGIPVITKRDLAAVLKTGVFNLVPYWSKKGLLIKSRDYFCWQVKTWNCLKKIIRVAHQQ